MFNISRYKNKIRMLENKIDGLNTANNLYREREFKLANTVEERSEKINKSLKNNIYVNENSIYIIYLFETKYRFDNIEIEIIDLFQGEKICALVAEFYSKEEIHISSIDTKNKYKNKGHGSIAIQMLISYVKDKNIKKIYGGMLIGESMDKLYKFYSKNGFNIKKSSFEMELKKDAN